MKVTSIQFNARENPRMLRSVQAAQDHGAAADLIREKRPAPPTNEGYVVVNEPEGARCHPDRPRVNPNGNCLECALAWYEKLLKGRK